MIYGRYLNMKHLANPSHLAEFKSVIGVNAFIKFSLQAFRKLKNQNQRRVLFLNLHILNHLLFVALLQKARSAMVKLTEYELEREKKIAANKKILESLGLGEVQNILPTRPQPPPKPKAATKKRASKKRKNGDGSKGSTVGEDEEDGRPKKTARRDDGDGDGKENVEGEEDKGPVRRSSRVAGKKAVDYRAVEDGAGQDRSSRSFRVSKAAKVEMDTEPRDSNRRTQNP